jgi:hypothetical protein
MCEVAMRKFQELEEPDEKYGQDYEKRRIFKEDQIGIMMRGGKKGRPSQYRFWNSPWMQLALYEMSGLGNWFRVLCHSSLRNVKRTLVLVL